jgi:hypothetical protein
MTGIPAAAAAPLNFRQQGCLVHVLQQMLLQQPKQAETTFPAFSD